MNEFRNGGPSSGTVVGSLTGFAIGAIVGAGIALLLAPDSGRRTRQRLSTTASKLTHVAGEKLDAAKSAVQELGTDAKAAWKAGQQSFTQDRERRSQSPVSQEQVGREATH